MSKVAHLSPAGQLVDCLQQRLQEGSLDEAKALVLCLYPDHQVEVLWTTNLTLFEAFGLLEAARVQLATSLE